MTDTTSWLTTNTRRLDFYFRWSMYPLPLVGVVLLGAQVPFLRSLDVFEMRVLLFAVIVYAVTASLTMVRSIQILRRGPSNTSSREIWVWIFASAVVCTAVYLFIGPPGLSTFLVISLIPLVTIARFRMALLLQAIGVASVVISTWSQSLPVLVTTTLLSFGLLSTTWLCAWMLSVFWNMDSARTTAARLAVAEERLRFSRDLHDVFGRVLSSVAVKSELAAGLAERGRSDDAATQMREVHTIAEEAGREVRAVVRGYRTVDFGQELRGAQSMLESSGVAVEVEAEVDSLDQRASTALGWVVREAVTNVLRHSNATLVTIAWEGATSSGWQLSITNDGVHDRTDHESGTGLLGLQERLARVGGSLYTENRHHKFTVAAFIPAESRARRGDHSNDNLGRARDIDPARR